MLFSEILESVRNTINDSILPYRFSDSLLIKWGNAGIGEIVKLRPDARFNRDGSKINTTPLSDTGYYEYTEDGNNPETISGYDKITGWDEGTYPTIYFKATSASAIVAYPSSSDVATGTNALFSISGADETGPKDVTEENSSGFGGTVVVENKPTADDTWNTEKVEKEMELDGMFKEPLIDYICHKCFNQDSEDTANMNRASNHYQSFIDGI